MAGKSPKTGSKNAELSMNSFLHNYIGHLVVLAVSIVVLILASKEVLPEWAIYIGLFGMLGDVLWFQNYTKKYRQGQQRGRMR